MGRPSSKAAAEKKRIVLAVLLFGRWRFGWRGPRAVKLTLTSMLLLLLAFFGSKFVLEVLLHPGL